MKGLLRKELCLYRTNNKIVIIESIFLLIMGALSSAWGFTKKMPVANPGGAFVILLLFVNSIGTLSLDETSRWDMTSKALPYKTDALILSKYLSVMLPPVIACASSLLIEVPICIAEQNFNPLINNIKMYLLMISAVFAIGSVILFPIVILGYQKGVQFMFLTCLVLGIICGVLAALDVKIHMPGSVYSGIIFAAAAVFAALVYYLSAVIYKKIK